MVGEVTGEEPNTLFGSTLGVSLLARALSVCSFLRLLSSSSAPLISGVRARSVLAFKSYYYYKH